MIKLNTTSLKIPQSLLEEKYQGQYKRALENIKEQKANGEIWFFDVDETVDIEKIEKFVSEMLNPLLTSPQGRGITQKNNSEFSPLGGDAWKAEGAVAFENLVVLWVGGSALGTLAIHQALKWKNWNLLSSKKRNNFLKLFVVDNVDPRKIRDTLDVLDLSKTLFVVISKSGGTIETKSMFKFFKKEVEKDIKRTSNSLSFWKESPEGERLERKIQDHFIITAWEKSEFRRKYKRKWYKVFGLQDNIGGRFSVLTNVWLLPLAFCWIDIAELMQWVKNWKTSFLKDDLQENIALHTALIHHYSYREASKNIQVFFPYIDSFTYFGEWYKQLVWESLGKWWMWVTTTTAVGVTDQHSQLQLYFDGPNDKLLIFLELEDFWVDYKIWKYSFANLMKYAKFGTEKSISKYNKLNYTLKISALDEQTIWELILMMEVQTAIIGELSGVNTYNQPWVEIGKRITKMKLKEAFWKSVVTIGWGNGHSNMLSGIKNSFIDKIDLKAIVSMSDDGRTTWKLMRAFKADLNIDFPPPGDLRRCLYFMSQSKYKADIEKYFETIFTLDIPVKELSIREMFKICWIRKGLLEEFVNIGWKDFLEYIVPIGSTIQGYKLWNILMWVLYYNYNQDYNKVMDFMHNLLRVEAKVIPVTTDRALIEVELENGDIVQTQDAISNGADYDSRVKEVRLMECSRDAKDNIDIETSLLDADYIVISAWDLFTSTISNLIIGWMKEIIKKSPAKIIFIWNTTNKGWETANFALIDFVKELEKYIWKNIDYFIVNDKNLKLEWKQLDKFKNDISVKWGEYIFLSKAEKKQLQENGTKIIEADLLDRKSLYKHNKKKLAEVLGEIIL